MPYVKRDENGKVIETQSTEYPDTQEYLPQEDKEVFEFTKKKVESITGVELNYREKRKYAFPSVGDQLDAIAKTFKYLWDNGVDIGPVGEAYTKQLSNTKKKFPKD